MHNDIKDIKLKDLRPWEKPIMIIKRHWIILVQLVLYFLFWIILSTLFYMFIPWILAYLVIILFWMPWSLFLFLEWMDHELDMYVITNNRIIWIDQMGFLNRKVAECNLWQVQEVWNQTKWLLANLLNYWTVTIQTAWNATNFTMSYSPNPIENSRKILNIVDKYRDENNKKTSI